MRVPLLVISLLALAAISAGDAGQHAVSIRNLKYTPETITVKAGDTVVWNNDDDRDHTVTADDNSFNSGKLGNSQTFQQTFKNKGKFPYHCKFHPRMKGTVIVSE